MIFFALSRWLLKVFQSYLYYSTGWSASQYPF